MVELTTTADQTTSMDGVEVQAADVGRAFGEWLQAQDIAVTTGYWTQHLARRGVRTTITEHHLFGKPLLNEELRLSGRTLRFEIHPRAFFQPNTRGAERLYDTVAEAAELLGGETVLDLYCGTGTIGLCLAHRAERVVGIELVESAVENARRNAAHNGIDNVTFLAGDVGKVLANEALSGDVVVVDPPRSGLMPAARMLIQRLEASRLVYVSCNPEALARDLVALHAAGWTTQSIRPVDMFPHTAHIECVATLTR